MRIAGDQVAGSRHALASAAATPVSSASARIVIVCDFGADLQGAQAGKEESAAHAGVPTANMAAKAVSDTLGNHDTGVGNPRAAPPRHDKGRASSLPD